MKKAGFSSFLFFFVELFVLLFFAFEIWVEDIKWSVHHAVASNDTWDFLNEDCLNALGDIGIGIGTSFASANHVDVDDSVFEANVFNVASFPLKEWADFAKNYFNLLVDLFHSARNIVAIFSLCTSKVVRRNGFNPL